MTDRLGVACLCLAVPALVSCAPPRPVALPPPGTDFERRQAVEIWRGSKAVTLHGVRVRGDSIQGIPLWKPPECDSCRVAVPLQGIDSLRAVNHEGSWMLAMAVPFLALGALAVAMHLGDGND